MSIQNCLVKYPVPEKVWEEYRLDQELNDRGIALDMDVVKNAVALDERSRSGLMETMKGITYLENPNSVVQMKQWLADNGLKTEPLGKKNVAKLIPDASDKSKEALQLRLQLAKSSVKKYQAMQSCLQGRAGARHVPVLRCQPLRPMGGQAHPAPEPPPEPHGRPHGSP